MRAKETAMGFLQKRHGADIFGSRERLAFIRTS